MVTVWESEEWLKQFAKPLNRSGGAYNSIKVFVIHCSCNRQTGAALRAQVREGQNGAEDPENGGEGDDDAMEE